MTSDSVASGTAAAAADDDDDVDGDDDGDDDDVLDGASGEEVLLDVEKVLDSQTLAVSLCWGCWEVGLVGSGCFVATEPSSWLPVSLPAASVAVLFPS